MIKVGVVGLGHMGGYHASLCSMIPVVNLVAVSDFSIEQHNKVKAPNVKKSRDFRDWISMVDAVIVAVPTDVHYEVAKTCILNGKHVLVEKPMTKNLEQAQELLELADAHNVTLHVGHVERFNGAVQEIKKIISEPFLIESHRMGPFAPRVQNDSVILDLMIHDLDIILSLVNSPVKDFNAHGCRVYSNSCDIASVQIFFENGVIAHVISSRVSQIKMRTMVIHQRNEFIQLDFTNQDILVHRQGSSSVQVGPDELKYRQESTIERLFVYKENALKLEIEYFINAIKSGNGKITPEQDLSTLALTFEIEKRLGLR
jgi:predicted dehydrogenase